ncbi:type VI secretion system baseplate subunit TssG [Celeribacter sp.]|uniref:type VI secretion system baseplate subunit TssG n=1 Tax=Celeribacter sp. TaxID=1890673 RepID=UPI003A9262CA
MNEKTEKARAERRKGWGFLTLMRHLERRAGKNPRVGENLRLRDEIADLGQDPFQHFPDSDLSDVDLAATPPVVRPRFLGLFGPFGPMPSAITREAAHWQANGDASFVRFADMLTARFQQLFYRSWSDARAITQFDHPTGGRFPDQLRAFTGDAGLPHRDRGAVDDTVRVRYTALTMGRVKSPIKLRELLKAHFNLPVRVEEFVASWLPFAPEDLSHLGQQGMTLGQNMRAGRRARSLGETLTLHLDCRDMTQFKGFLPGRPQARELQDLVAGYLGPFFDVNVALWLPKGAIAPAQLGQSMELGWMSALPLGVQPTSKITDGNRVQVCRFRITQDMT